MAPLGPSEIVALGSAMLANLVTVLVTFPLDTIKTRQQTAAGPTRPNYTRGLFKGIAPTVVFTTPCCGLYFSTFEAMQRRFNPKQTLKGDIGSACSAQILTGLLLIPGDILKVNLQTGTYPHVRAALRSLLTNVQWGQAMRAMLPKLRLSYFRDFSFATIQMTLYVNLNRQGDYLALFAGALAAGTASLITTPLDTLRTRHMLAADSGLRSSAMAQTNYFAGTVPRVVLAAMSGLIFFRCYELIKPFVYRQVATEGLVLNQ